MTRSPSPCPVCQAEPSIRNWNRPLIGRIHVVWCFGGSPDSGHALQAFGATKKVAVSRWEAIAGPAKREKEKANAK